MFRYGPLVYLATDEANLELAGEVFLCRNQLLEPINFGIQFYDSGKIDSAVSHGPGYVLYS